MKVQTTRRVLTVLSYVGLAGTAYLAIQAGRKASKMESEKNLGGADLKTKVKHTYKAYIPAGAAMVSTGVCMGLSHKVSSKEIAALSGLLAVTKKFHSKYEERVKTTLSDKVNDRIKKEVVDDNAKEKLKEKKEKKFKGRGPLLVYEPCSDQYFYSSRNRIERARYQANQIFSKDGLLVLNQWLDLLGCPRVSYGEKIGWWQGIDLWDELWYGWFGSPFIKVDFHNGCNIGPNGEEQRFIEIVYPTVAPDISYDDDEYNFNEIVNDHLCIEEAKERWYEKEADKCPK